MNEQKIYDEYIEFYNLYDAVNMPLTPFGNFSKGYETAWRHQQKRIDDVLVSALEASNKYNQYCVLAEKKIEETEFELNVEQAWTESLQTQLTIAVDALRFYADLDRSMFDDGKVATEALNKIRSEV